MEWMDDQRLTRKHIDQRRIGPDGGVDVRLERVVDILKRRKNLFRQSEYMKELNEL